MHDPKKKKKKKGKKSASAPWGISTSDKDEPKVAFGIPQMREPRSSTGFPGLKKGKKRASEA